MEHFGYFSWIQRPKIYRNQLQNWRQFFGRLPVLRIMIKFRIELFLLKRYYFSKFKGFETVQTLKIYKRRQPSKTPFFFFLFSSSFVFITHNDLQSSLVYFKYPKTTESCLFQVARSSHHCLSCHTNWMHLAPTLFTSSERSPERHVTVKQWGVEGSVKFEINETLDLR